MDAVWEWTKWAAALSQVAWLVFALPAFLIALLCGRITMKRLRRGDFS